VPKAEPRSELAARPNSNFQVVVPARALGTKKQAREADSIASEALRASSERLVDEGTPPARGASTRPVEPVKESGYEELDEAYARELGFTDAKAPVRPDPRAEKSVWIPPAPGEHALERLTPEAINRVVLSHKSAITACIEAHQAGTHGSFVTRWNLQTDGSTSDVAVETTEYRGTPLARCMENLIRTWKFPRHRVQKEEPIRFPVTF
jgi:hypothetical protein